MTIWVDLIRLVQFCIWLIKSISQRLIH